MALTPKDFTQQSRVTTALASLNRNKQLSDVVDLAGHQYVDLVMEGGGVLGIALLGYVYTLEEAGLRFMGIGGTSAGAINALLTAAAATPDERKTEKLIEVLANMPMKDFVDGDSDARDFVDTMLSKPGFTKLLWKLGQIVDNIKEDLGLNPGSKFLTWATQTLAAFGITTAKQLQDRMLALPALRRRDGSAYSTKDADPKLAVVTADLTTESKVIFPEMAGLYWANPDAVNPANFVRASMSIPLFFHPFRVKNLPSGPNAAADWAKFTGYRGTLPDEVMFVDGGILSNFPIDVFHVDGVPSAPTLGVKLDIDRSKPNEIDSPQSFLGAIFESTRQYSDFTFLHRHPDYEHLIGYINTKGHNWLQFEMKDADKLDLFARGVETAVQFLNGFDWPKYREIRLKLAEAKGIVISDADRKRAAA